MNVQEKYYLPDVIEIFMQNGENVEAIPVDDPITKFGTVLYQAIITSTPACSSLDCSSEGMSSSVIIVLIAEIEVTKVKVLWRNLLESTTTTTSRTILIIVIRQTLPDKITFLLRETSMFHKVFHPQMRHAVCQSYKTVPRFPISCSNQHHLYR